MEGYLLGVDIGTTNIKAVIFDAWGNRMSSGASSYTTSRFSDIAEQDAEECWRQTALAIKMAVNALPEQKNGISGVCVSAHTPTLLPLDRGGKPLRKGMIWSDTRAKAQSKEIEAMYGGAEAYIAKYGARANPCFMNAKLLWLAQKEPDIFYRTERILTTNGYINYRLTGEYSVDRQQMKLVFHLYDFAAGSWDQRMEQRLGRRLASLFPEPKNSWDVIGTVSPEAAELTGLPAGTPVVCGTSDGVAAPLETGITQLGDVADITGTSTLVYMAHDKPMPGSPLLVTAQEFPLPNCPYLAQGSINAAGGALGWYLKLFERSTNASAFPAVGLDGINALAAQAKPGSGGMLFLPHLNGERAPYWDAGLRGAFLGMGYHTGHAEFSRSLLEGTAFALRGVIDCGIGAGIRAERIMHSGGGSSSDLWVRIKASVLNRPITVLAGNGAPGGDAIIAGYGLGWYSDFQEAVLSFRKVKKQLDPEPQWVRVYDDRYPAFLEAQRLSQKICAMA